MPVFFWSKDWKLIFKKATFICIFNRAFARILCGCCPRLFHRWKRHSGKSGSNNTINVSRVDPLSISTSTWLREWDGWCTQANQTAIEKPNEMLPWWARPDCYDSKLLLYIHQPYVTFMFYDLLLLQHHHNLGGGSARQRPKTSPSSFNRRFLYHFITCVYK